jgi:hypothetical protein
MKKQRKQDREIKKRKKGVEKRWIFKEMARKKLRSNAM